MQRQLGRYIGMFSCVILAAAAAGQPDLRWIDQFGTSDLDYAYALASDGAGGVFVAGETWGNLGGPNAGKPDAFLVRYDTAGKPAWIKQLGTNHYEAAYALAPDGIGGVFITGRTDSALGGLNAGGADVFLARYDNTGNRAWITQFGSNLHDYAHALAPDGTGGVFIAGRTNGSLGGPNAGGLDVFLARYDAAGKSAPWVEQFGTSDSDYAYALAPDGAGGVFVTGWTGGSLGGPNAGGPDVFLARYDAAGKRAWIEQFGTSDSDYAYALAPDGAGGVFVTGWTGGSLGGLNAGGPDVFLARYDAAGKRAWIEQFGTSDSEFAYALAPDGAGGVFVAGPTEGNLGGPNVGNEDIFLARYDDGGMPAWIKQLGSSDEDFTRALAPDGAGGVFIAGNTWGNLGGSNAGLTDAFLARFGADCYGDCDANGTLDLFDFLCFVNLFNAGAEYADCDGDGASDLFDFLCFVNAFNVGC